MRSIFAVTGFISACCVILAFGVLQITKEHELGTARLAKAVEAGCARVNHNGHYWVYKCNDVLWLEYELRQGFRDPH